MFAGVGSPLNLTRSQILAYRRHVQALNERLPAGPRSLEVAAWAGLQDSMPRAALLSIHARVDGTTPTTWEDASLVQLWGPRFSAYVVAARDVAIFSLGRLGDDHRSRLRAEELASRLKALLRGRKMPYGAAGEALGEHPNRLRYAALTGTVLMRWDGARQPTIWNVPAPGVDRDEAQLELARRYLHIFGPATAPAFAGWAGASPADGRAVFDALAKSVTPVRTPVGDAFVLERDEPGFRRPPEPPAAARLLPSGDNYWLLQGADREVLVPDGRRRRELWTPRVWPGAILVDGEVVGTWRRSGHTMSLHAWGQLAAAQRAAVQAEAESLPLPGLQRQVVVRWTDEAV
jgi:hypothetical protein